MLNYITVFKSALSFWRTAIFTKQKISLELSKIRNKFCCRLFLLIYLIACTVSIKCWGICIILWATGQARLRMAHFHLPASFLTSNCREVRNLSPLIDPVCPHLDLRTKLEDLLDIRVASKNGMYYGSIKSGY